MLKAKECLAGSLIMYPGLYPQFIAKYHVITLYSRCTKLSKLDPDFWVHDPSLAQLEHPTL
jgi:hypothetical protein